VLFFALNLIAHRQMGHAVTLQAEGVVVAGGVFGSGEGCGSAGFFVDWTFAMLGLVVAICGILKNIATALKESKTAADANFEPEFIRKRGAVASGSGEIEKPIKRFQKFETDGGFAEMTVRHIFFQL
jgi:hypothetical protein